MPGTWSRSGSASRRTITVGPAVAAKTEPHPADVTDMFEQRAYLALFPPIRLHDLRHGAATLLLAAGHDMRVVQETLGLSSITIAANTYTSVLPQLYRQSAEDVADLIRTGTRAPAARRSGAARTRAASAAATGRQP